MPVAAFMLVDPQPAAWGRGRAAAAVVVVVVTLVREGRKQAAGMPTGKRQTAHPMQSTEVCDTKRTAAPRLVWLVSRGELTMWP